MDKSQSIATRPAASGFEKECQMKHVSGGRSPLIHKSTLQRRCQRHRTRLFDFNGRLASNEIGGFFECEADEANFSLRGGTQNFA
jgi:hypothetical protein